MQDIKNARISQMIIEEMARGSDIRTAIDRVLGAGTWQRIADELYDAFMARNAAEGGAA